MVVLAGALIGIKCFSGAMMVRYSLWLWEWLRNDRRGDMFMVIASGADGSGVTGMYDITVISIVVACIVSLVKEMGGIQFILNFIKKRIRGEGGELGIAGLALLVDKCTANNTVAIVMAVSDRQRDQRGI